MRTLKLLQRYAEYKNLPKKTVNLQRSMRPRRSKTLGYKNAPGFVLYLANIRKGGIEPNIPRKGRKPSNIYKKYSRKLSLKQILQNRIKKKHKNLRFIGSYYIGQNKYNTWYEMFFIDPVLVRRP
jgi:ribosomal protein L15E